MTNCNPDAEVIDMVNDASAQRQKDAENRTLHALHCRRQEQERAHRISRIMLRGITECGGYAIIGGASLVIALTYCVSPYVPLLISFCTLFLTGWRTRDFVRAVMSV